MAIHITCPSCRAEAAVDDGQAGKDVLCPHCQERITVPSLAAGAPEERRIRAAAWDDDLAPRDYERDENEREPLPRYRDDDDYTRDERRGAWSTTSTGLALIFWAGAGLTATSILSNILTMLIGPNPQAFAMGGAGAPRPEIMAAGLFMMLVGCATLILAVVTFVGMCMCCTVPAESGAKSFAIISVIGLVVLVIGFIALMVGSGIAAMNQMRAGVVPQPGQLPFSPALFLAISIGGGVFALLIVALWMMFHKKIADYFQNSGLARASVWYIAAFAAFGLIGQALNFIANPQMLEGNLLAPPPNQALLLVAQAWGLIGLAALSIWYLMIVRETRRVIAEGM